MPGSIPGSPTISHSCLPESQSNWRKPLDFVLVLAAEAGAPPFREREFVARSGR